MATIAPQLFMKGEDQLEGEDQLLRLFWNRAELKKELDGLRADAYRLTEEIKNQEAKTLRVQHRMQQLEARLSNPEHSATVVAYYQLKGIWEHCHQRLASLSTELERAQHDKGYRLHLAAFKREIGESLVDVQSELQDATEHSDALSARIRVLRERYSLRSGLWNFFLRRKLTAELNELQEERQVVRLRIGKLTEEIQARAGREVPDYSGLDTAAKRNINVMIIAYAQELYLHFADRELASNAREASIRQLIDVSYGNKRDCRALSKYAEDKMKLLAADSKFQSRVQLRARQLPSLISYGRDVDTVPSAVTLGVIPLLKPDGRQRGEVPVNVLGDEYWDVFSVLLV